MKASLIIFYLFICASLCAQDTAKTEYAILKTDYQESTFKVIYQNGTVEDLVPLLKLNAQLNIAIPSKAKDATEKITFRCLEYMDSKGFELITFSAYPYYKALIAENSSFYREYIFRKKSK